MTTESERFQAAIDRFDAANSEDPNRESFEGEDHPKELLYARRVTEWLEKIAPDAAEPLRLAARAQHICRWRILRKDYPMDRTGYLKWRTDLAKFHSYTAAEILRGVGYDEGTIERVQSLLRKQGLKSDADTQTLEDVVCVVFLEDYFSDFAERHDEEKLINIIQKTWKKMSPRGHQAALTLHLRPEDRTLIEKALAQ